MTDRPILMMDSMVQAILDGRKTVTRRVGKTWAAVQPGTRLWVREAHAFGAEHPQVRVAYRASGMSYGRFQDEHGWHCIFPEPLGIRVPFPKRWRPAIHLPRWACRLELEVVSVTEQRSWQKAPRVPLPDVDEPEARREGFRGYADFIDDWLRMHPDHAGPVFRIEFRRAP